MATFTRIETTDNAIEATSDDGRGVVAKSTKNYGLRASSTESAGIRGSSERGRGVEGWAIDSEGIVGISANGSGVWGQTEGAGVGVKGTSIGGAGVAGRSQRATGVRGDSTDGRGLEGFSSNDYGLFAHSDRSAGIRGTSSVGRGVEGWGTRGEGVVGLSETNSGVWGQTRSGAGVLGSSLSGVGVSAVSETGEGVHAQTQSPDVAAIAAYNLHPEARGAAIFAEKRGPLGHAGFFVGHVHVSKNLTVEGDIILPPQAADCAEDFDIADLDAAEPGTIMVLGDDEALHASFQAYDRRVAGVISGAGAYRPGIVLDKQPGRPARKPVALLGKVYCKVDASYASIEVGDLLTTSPSPGHAMKASDPARAFGAVLGKALRALDEGCGLIPILVTLQ